MPYTIEDLKRDYYREGIKMLTPEERLQGLSPQERLEGLTTEEIAELLKEIRKDNNEMQDNGDTPKKGGSPSHHLPGPDRV